MQRHQLVVDSHRIVYYDNGKGKFSDALGPILPTRTYKGYTYKPFEFSEEPWYIALEGNWKCAQLNFPIYTTYTSGTMVFRRSPFNVFDVQFVDIPTDIELMAQVIQGQLIDGKVGHVLDDKFGDYTDFLRLSPATIRSCFEELQLFQRPSLSRDQAIRHARKIFFLCFNIIPIVEAINDKEAIKKYRENNLKRFLEYFRNVTLHVNFEDDNEEQFFDNVVDLLFGDAWSYKNFDIEKFEDRVFIFHYFINSEHYRDIAKRGDWLYLYCLIYTYYPDYHTSFKANPAGLSDCVQRFSSIPFHQASGTYPQGGM